MYNHLYSSSHPCKVTMWLFPSYKWINRLRETKLIFVKNKTHLSLVSQDLNSELWSICLQSLPHYHCNTQHQVLSRDCHCSCRMYFSQEAEIVSKELDQEETKWVMWNGNILFKEILAVITDKKLEWLNTIGVYFTLVWRPARDTWGCGGVKGSATQASIFHLYTWHPQLLWLAACSKQNT